MLLGLGSILALSSLSAQVVGGRGEPGGAPDPGAFQVLLSDALSDASVSEAKQTASLVQAGAVTPTIVDFDDVQAPSLFIYTTPLHGYHQGVYFRGYGARGGAILNGVSDFGITPYSVPNFLGFDNFTSFSLPELMVFGAETTSVSFWISGGSHPGYQLGVIAFGPDGVVGNQTVVTQRDWTQITVSAEHISSIKLIGLPYTLVLDEIVVQ